ncbi:FAD-dependent oxidoreductase [Gordonia sp. NPDC003376]
MSQPRMVIVGAGIGGLVLSIAMQQRGWEVEVYEQAPALDEVGAGVALWSNATRLLGRLGLGDAIEAVSAEPTEVMFRDGISGDKIVGFPLVQDQAYRTTFGSPYFGIHRKVLQQILADAVADGTIRLGHRLDGLETLADGRTRLTFDGVAEPVDADIVIGADGIRSVVRSWMFAGLDYTMYSKTSGFRGVVPTSALPSLPDPTATQFWVGDGAHLLHFPMAADYEYVTFLAVEEDPKIWPNPGASRAACTTADALRPFLDWHPAVSEMIAAAAPVERWGLFGVGPLPTWAKGNVALLGDAAHGLLPHHGQGANQCVEDAIVLADLLASDPHAPIADVLARYSDLRYARAQHVQKISWVSNRLFHLAPGPEIPLRDATFRDLEKNVSWIHAYDAQAVTNAPVAAQ